MYTTSSTLLAHIGDLSDSNRWREFYRRYRPLIYKVARDQGLDEADAEDVVQSVMLAVASAIEQYDRSRGAFRRWLLGITFNKIHDTFTQRGRGRSGNDLAIPARELTDDHPIVQLWEREWRQTVLRQAIDKVRTDGDDTAFQAFWLRVVYGWKVQDVAETLGIKAERVYDYKHRIAKRIAEEYEAGSQETDED